MRCFLASEFVISETSGVPRMAFSTELIAARSFSSVGASTLISIVLEEPNPGPPPELIFTSPRAEFAANLASRSACTAATSASSISVTWIAVPPAEAPKATRPSAAKPIVV